MLPFVAKICCTILPIHFIGDARVSTEKQSLGLQLDALTKAGCQTIYKDAGVSGTAREQAELTNVQSEASRSMINLPKRFPTALARIYRWYQSRYKQSYE